MPFITTFLYSQFFRTPACPTTSFSGQTIIVTGASSGLGLEATRHLVRLDAEKVILAVRNEAKGKAAVADILRSTKRTDAGCMEIWPLDLASRASIVAFAHRVEGLQRLDAVVENAGIMTEQYVNVEGMESTIAVNVVHTVLLGLLVLPKLRESAAIHKSRGRLAFNGSDLQYVANLQDLSTEGSILELLNSETTANMKVRYKTSKLLLLYAVRSIAEKSPISPSSNVIINYLTPGFCESDLARDPSGWLFQVVISIFKALLARTTEVGSRTLVDAVRPDIGPETHGAFLMDTRVVSNGSNVDSEEGKKIQKKFTKELFETLEEMVPGSTSI